MGFWDDEYESSTEIYCDENKFVMRTYFNGKKNSNVGLLQQNRKTGELNYNNTNPLMDVIGGLIVNKQNKKIKQIERR